MKISSLLLCYYITHGLHWWANFEFGILNSYYHMCYACAILGANCLALFFMLRIGAIVNKKVSTAEFYEIMIAEEELRLKE